MGARGDLRYHAAIGRMQIELRTHHIGKNFALPVRRTAHHGGGSLVAARLDSEHDKGGVFAGRNHGAFYSLCAARLKGKRKGAINAGKIWRASAKKLKEFRLCRTSRS